MWSRGLARWTEPFCERVAPYRKIQRSDYPVAIFCVSNWIKRELLLTDRIESNIRANDAGNCGAYDGRVCCAPEWAMPACSRTVVEPSQVETVWRVEKMKQVVRIRQPPRA